MENFKSFKSLPLGKSSRLSEGGKRLSKKK